MPKTTAPGGAQAWRERRHEVEERLRAVGPVERVAPPAGRLGPDEHHAERLRDALLSLGPIFAAFGLYLSSRLDLFARRDCLELSRIPDAGAPSAAGEVAELIRRELGALPAHRFHTFDARPIGVNLLFQEHAASLAPGAPVVVRIVRPEVVAALDRDVPLLGAIAPHVAIASERLAEAIADFTLTLDHRLDQRAQAEMFHHLADDWRAIGAFDAPLCYTDHCATRVLTMAPVDGVLLGDAFQHGAISASRYDRETTVRQICAAWLRQALEGHAVPIAFGPRDIRLRPDRLVYVGTEFELQSSDARVRFLAYVNAAAADDPDAAVEWVIAECEPKKNGAAEEELRRRFRQSVPFRDGEASGDDTLAEHLLVHWRATHDSGWTLGSHLLHLYRSVHALSLRAEALAPGRDVLMLGLQDVRLRIGLSEAQQLVNPLNLPAALDKLLANMVNLPQKLDEVLTLAAEGRLRLKLHLPSSEEQRRLRNGTVSLIAGLAVLASSAFLFRVVVPEPGVALERIGALVLLVAGFWLLKAARDL
jgi:hypothetical protein